MSWGVAWYALTVVLSFIALTGSRAGAHLSLVELVAGSVPLAAVVGSWLVYLACMAWAAFTPGTVAAGTSLLVLAAAVNARAAMARLFPSRRSLVAACCGGGGSGLGGRWDAADSLLLLAVAAAAAWVLGPIYSQRMIPSSSDGRMIMTAASCYGDLPIHMGASADAATWLA